MKTKKAKNVVAKKEEVPVEKAQEVVEVKPIPVVNIESLRQSISSWEEILVASADKPEQVINYRDTAKQMNVFVDIIRDAVVPEMKALAVMSLNAVYYGSPFIGELLMLFDGLSQGKHFIEAPDTRLFQEPASRA